MDVSRTLEPRSRTSGSANGAFPRDAVGRQRAGRSTFGTPVVRSLVTTEPLFRIPGAPAPVSSGKGKAAEQARIACGRTGPRAATSREESLVACSDATATGDFHFLPGAPLRPAGLVHLDGRFPFASYRQEDDKRPRDPSHVGLIN